MLPNLARMFFDSVDKWRDKTVIKYKNDGVYRDVSYTKAATYVRAMAHVLKQRGVKKGDKIAILSENRPEWWYADLATLSLGAVTVPIYATNSPKETSYILCDSEVKVLFVSTNEQLNHIKDELKLCQSLKTVIMFDDSQTIESFWRLVEAYKSNPADLIEIENIGPDDLATIIYTSGTTGDPKGVMLTHGNLLSNISASSRAIAIRPSDTLLSILPLSHVFERMGGFYLQLYIGSTVAFAENMKTSAQNLIEIGPTIVLAVPRFFEKVNENIWIEIRARGTWAVALFNLSIKIGRKFSQLKRSGLKPSFLLKCAYKFFDMLVFSKIKKKMGGHIRFFVSGGAPLPKDLAEFFHAIDILILEGYGLTETSPVIAANHEERYRFGSVGLPIENVQVKIAEDGEILIKGPNVMKGYYKHEAETRAVIHDGWFSTGDIGHLDSDNYLYITDRKKDLIKTSGGKYVSPQKIERIVSADDWVDQVFVCGDQRRFIVGLIFPNFKNLEKYAYEHNIPYETQKDLLINVEIKRIFDARIQALQKDLAEYEKIKYFTLIPDELTLDGGVLTPTLKMKRRILVNRYQNEIEKMYQNAVSHEA